MSASTPRQKLEDGKFLADEFDIPPQKAAELVSEDGRTTQQVDEGIRRERHSDDPASDLTPDADETRRKPVVPARNNRAGAG